MTTGTEKGGSSEETQKAFTLRKKKGCSMDKQYLSSWEDLRRRLRISEKSFLLCLPTSGRSILGKKTVDRGHPCGLSHVKERVDLFHVDPGQERGPGMGNRGRWVLSQHTGKRSSVLEVLETGVPASGQRKEREHLPDS